MTQGDGRPRTASEARPAARPSDAPRRVARRFARDSRLRGSRGSTDVVDRAARLRRARQVARPVATEVEADARQPAAQVQLLDALRWPAAQAPDRLGRRCPGPGPRRRLDRVTSRRAIAEDQVLVVVHEHRRSCRRRHARGGAGHSVHTVRRTLDRGRSVAGALGAVERRPSARAGSRRPADRARRRRTSSSRSRRRVPSTLVTTAARSPELRVSTSTRPRNDSPVMPALMISRARPRCAARVKAGRAARSCPSRTAIDRARRRRRS